MMLGAWGRLAAFWVSVLVLGAGSAAGLQILGPPPAPAPAPVPILGTTHASASSPGASAGTPLLQPSPPAPGLIRPPDPALLEPAAEYPGRFLPRRAADGRAAMSFYARAPDMTDKRPAVAVLVVGLGQSTADSQSAIDALPGAVSLGFSPYTPDPTALLAMAREHGHEYFVTLPMESQGYPLNDSGPHALLTGADPAANQRNLDWVLSRMQGEVGLTGASDGLRGERFASAGPLIGQVQEQLRKRGLIYVDPRPGAAPQPRSAVATVVIDDPPERTSIDAKLSQLEQRARDGDVALGLAVVLRPVTIERIAAWARGLDGRGVQLVPVSALVLSR